MPKRPTRAFVIGAASSGSGKTTLTLAMLSALAKRGLSVQPFKAGPDYIDPGHHSAVSGRPSYNLDTWMTGPAGAAATFAARSSASDVAVVEGVMGLFDGRGGGGLGGDDGSTASLARTLGLSVLLVVNAEKTAGSVAAIVKGFESFDPDVDVRWVVFNRVAGARHHAMLKRAVEAHTGVKVLGSLPRTERLEMPSRHLGLVTQSHINRGRWKSFLSAAAAAVDEHLDLDLLLRTAPRVRAAGAPGGRCAARPGGGPKVRIAVARDDAFSFYYQENLDILEDAGAELVFTSPISSRRLPRGVSGLYLGGGYPELHAGELEANSSMRDAVRRAALSGMPVFAECGGLMYLGRRISPGSGQGSRRMAGVFPWSARMLAKRAALGYREATALDGCPFLPKGSTVRGHEYHYSALSPSAGRVGKSLSVSGGPAPSFEGFTIRNVLATYVHLHFRSNIEFAARFVERAALYAENSLP